MDFFVKFGVESVRCNMLDEFNFGLYLSHINQALLSACRKNETGLQVMEQRSSIRFKVSWARKCVIFVEQCLLCQEHITRLRTASLFFLDL